MSEKPKDAKKLPLLGELAMPQALTERVLLSIESGVLLWENILEPMVCAVLQAQT